MGNYSNKKSGSGKGVFVIIIFIIIACVAASNFFGPAKGWVEKITNGKDKKRKIVLNELSPEKPDPDKPPKLTYMVEPEEPGIKEKSDPVEPEEEEKSEVKELYDSLYTKYREKYPDPTVGKEYDVYLKTGRTRGKLKDFSDGKIVIQKPGVTVTYRLDTVSRRSYKQLFPSKAAKILALRELKTILDEKNSADAPPVTDNMPAGSVSPQKETSSKTFEYEPGPQPSPQSLQKPLKSFAQWISVQQRRVGGKLGEKVYAKKQGDNVVLYMHTSKLFDAQDYDVRFTVTGAMWQIWGFKCLDYGAARNTSQAHVVLVDRKNRIVGGSKKDDSSNIWVKK